MFLVVRTTTDAYNIAPILRRELASLDRDLSLGNVRTMTNIVGAANRSRRAQTLLIALFAFVALALASVGVYGSLSWQVARRTREIGLRIAFGARYGDVLKFVFRQAAVWAGVGLAVGVLATIGLSSLLRSLVYGVSPINPLWLLIATSLATAAAALACLIPARRATKVDPMVALRYE